jgi:hypothetical protein
MGADFGSDVSMRSAARKVVPQAVPGHVQRLSACVALDHFRVQHNQYVHDAVVSLWSCLLIVLADLRVVGDPIGRDDTGLVV